MILLREKFLAAKIGFALTLTVGGISLFNRPAYAGIPVIDVTGLTQHVLSAVQNVQQTLQLIQSYQTQLLQLENQLKNTMNPNLFLWDQANVVISDLVGQIDTIRYYRNQFGSVENYMGKFKDLEYYRSSSCLTAGCSPTELIIFQEQVKQEQAFHSEAVKRNNLAVIKGLDRQQNQLESDANRLRDLQVNAQSAQGQLEAIQHANQLASAQANQLLQIRALMVSQQSALAVSSQQSSSDEALRRALWERATAVEHVPVTKPTSLF